MTFGDGTYQVVKVMPHAKDISNYWLSKLDEQITFFATRLKEEIEKEKIKDTYSPAQDIWGDGLNEGLSVAQKLITKLIDNK